MATDLKPGANKLTDPEASYRPGFQHDALALLDHITAKLDRADVQTLTNVGCRRPARLAHPRA
jgi:hypothetical protein